MTTINYKRAEEYAENSATYLIFDKYHVYCKNIYLIMMNAYH